MNGIEMELGFAWHHSKQPRHARLDFEDMVHNNCNAILIAASENDLEYWYPNLMDIIAEAKDIGLKVYFNFWALGGVFGGEPPSIFLHQNYKFRQITASSKECVPAACINRPEFVDYLSQRVKRIVQETRVDSIFIDEPHYYPLFDKSEFTCVCDTCQQKFREMMNKKMPMEYNEDIQYFREKCMLEFLEDMCNTVKSAKSSTEVVICTIPTKLLGLGTPDWSKIASLRSLDVFSTDPYYHVFGKDRQWALDAAQRTVDTAKQYGKKSQLWLQMFRLPAGAEKDVSSLIPIYRDLGVDSIFGWSYLANKGTTISSDNPDQLWKLVTDEYKKIPL